MKGWNRRLEVAGWIKENNVHHKGNSYKLSKGCIGAAREI